MKEENLKISFVLFIFLVLDLIKPLDYSLNVEFLFLGIVFLSSNYPLIFSFLLSMIFGYLKDILMGLDAPLNLIEFSFLSLAIRYFLFFFHKKTTNHIILIALSLFFHIFLNSVYFKITNFLFFYYFFIQSIFIYFLINYFLKRWIKNLSPEYI
jgi:hypothetical protein